MPYVYIYIHCASEHSSVARQRRYIFPAHYPSAPHLLGDFHQHVGVRDVLALLEVPVEQLLDHVAALVLLVGEADQAVRPDGVVHPPVVVEVDAGRFARPLQRHRHPGAGAFAVLLLQVLLARQQAGARKWEEARATAKLKIGEFS